MQKNENTDIYLGLGANIGKPVEQLKSAIEQIKAIENTQVLEVSKLYKSKPLDSTDQPDFYNCALKIQSDLKPLELLATIKKIEDNHLRQKTVRWGPRTLDIDILLYHNQCIQLPQLIIPHIGIEERLFVLLPLQNLKAHLSWRTQKDETRKLSKVIQQFDKKELKLIEEIPF